MDYCVISRWQYGRFCKFLNKVREVKEKSSEEKLKASISKSPTQLLRGKMSQVHEFIQEHVYRNQSSLYPWKIGLNELYSLSVIQKLYYLIYLFVKQWYVIKLYNI